MKTPKFWYNAVDDKGLAARLLTPIGKIYTSITAKRIKQAPKYTSKHPVICVGNLTAGGTGKTPVVMSLIALFKTEKVKTYILSRGYGGSQKEPLLVAADKHDASLVGDEPLMLADYASVIVVKDRVKGMAYIDALIGDKKAVIIMDDGFQNPELKKDMSLIVVDGAVGFGNGLGIPAGPLRENIRGGLARAAALLVIGEDETGVEARYCDGLPYLQAKMRLDPSIINSLKEERYIAFAGIGRPEKFFECLKNQCEGEMVGKYAFADHRPYKQDEIDMLKADSRAKKAKLVTTVKDFVRLSVEMKKEILPISATLEWQDEAALKMILKPIIDKIKT